MPVTAYIPWLDIFLGLLFLGLIVLGFYQGLLKELWLLLSLYLGAVLASLYGDTVGGLIGRGLGTDTPAVSSATGFFIVFTLATGILFLIIYALFGQLRLHDRLLVLDKVGGITLGLLTSFFITSFVAYLLNAILAVQGTEAWAFVTILRDQRQTSPLFSTFMQTRYVLMTIVAPWLPDLPQFLKTTS